MSPFSNFVKHAAIATAKGAGVTLTSTVFSCGLACYIEIGGHRLVYKYFPHKYANVEFANGLTQEQLDAVRVQVQTESEAAMPTIMYQEEGQQEQQQEHVLHQETFPQEESQIKEIQEQPWRLPVFNNSSSRRNDTHEQQDEESTNGFNKFWSEDNVVTRILPSKEDLCLPTQEIIACSMTG